MYVDSDEGQVLPGGAPRHISVQISVPGDPAELAKEYPLDGLRATRLA